jgi:hypothetical protein
MGSHRNKLTYSNSNDKNNKEINMRSKRLWALIILMSGLGSGQDFYRCYGYQASVFRLVPPVAYQQIVLAVPKVWPHEVRYPSVLLFLDRSGREMIMDQYVECPWDANLTRYVCRGECDAGSMLLDRNMTLSFDDDHRIQADIDGTGGQMSEEERTSVYFVPGIDHAQAKPVHCPLYIEQLFDPIREGEHGDAGPLKHVCYTSKNQTHTSLRYTGCTLQPRKCDKIGKKHFGDYPNIFDAYDAYLRCEDGKPLHPAQH